MRRPLDLKTVTFSVNYVCLASTVLAKDDYFEHFRAKMVAQLESDRASAMKRACQTDMEMGLKRQHLMSGPPKQMSEGVPSP